MTYTRIVILVSVSVAILALTVGVGNVAAQSPGAEEFNKTFGGPDNDRARSVVQTSDRGYALAGNTKSFTNSLGDMWLIKTDTNGTEDLNKTFGGSMGNNVGYSVTQTPDGGFALSGLKEFLLKTDGDGNKEFNKTFPARRLNRAFSIARTSDGGFALAGFTDGRDAFLIKTDSAGDIEFSNTFGGSDSDTALSVIQTQDGGYAFAGQARSFGSGRTDVWLVKTDASGNEQINRTYGGPSRDRAEAIVQTSDGGYALAGETWSFGSQLRDPWLVKTDSNGNEEFNKTFGGFSNKFTSVVQTPDRGYALAGFFEGNASLVRTTAAGDVIFNNTYGGAEGDAARSIVQTQDGGYALGGDTRSFGSGGQDAWLVKVSGRDNPFTQSLIDRFKGPPTNTGKLDDTLYEDLSGDRDGKDVSQTVSVFGELIRGRDLGLTDGQARKLNWNPNSPETKVTPGDMVSLFGEQIRAD